MDGFAIRPPVDDDPIVPQQVNTFGGKHGLVVTVLSGCPIVPTTDLVAGANPPTPTIQ